MKSSQKANSVCFLNMILGNDFECTIFKPSRIQYYENTLQVKSAEIIDQVMTDMLTHESMNIPSETCIILILIRMVRL
jgi:hypothetical protein